MTKNLILLFFLTLFKSTLAQNDKITFSDLLAFKNMTDLPTDIFAYFQKKGFEFVKKVNLADEVNDTSHGSNKCNIYYYGNGNCTGSIWFCDDRINIPFEDYAINVTVAWATNANYDYLVEKIKTNCTYFKTEESKQNGLPVRVYFYKHSSGSVFEFKKYMSTDNQVNYFVSIHFR